MKKRTITAWESKVSEKKLSLPFTESALLDGLTPETAHADELAILTMLELGQKPADKH